MNDYMVFARTEYDEPVEHQGNIQAADDEEAKKVAVEQFGGEWLELVLIPERDVHWVMRKQEVEAPA
jgi:1,2-phenylacetyl-CoA epoxidase PaaB subunit